MKEVLQGTEGVSEEHSAWALKDRDSARALKDKHLPDWKVLFHHRETSWMAGNQICCSCYSVAKLCLTLCNPLDCSPPGSFVGFPRQEYWSQLPFPSSGDLPDPRIEPSSPALASGFFTSWAKRKPLDASVNNEHTILSLHFYYCVKSSRFCFPLEFELFLFIFVFRSTELVPENNIGCFPIVCWMNECIHITLDSCTTVFRREARVDVTSKESKGPFSSQDEFCMLLSTELCLASS